jgi:HAMP domain-containing protein
MTADTGSVLANAPTATPSLSSSHLAPSIDLRELLGVLEALRGGDFSVRLTGDHDGTLGRIASVVNDIAAGNESMAGQLERIGKAVGEQGRTRQRVKFGLSAGAWGEMETSVNTLIDDLVWPTTEVTRVIAAVAQGDLLQTVRLDVDGRPLKGEFLRSATIVNTMIKQLSVFTSEVTRVAREVGTEGKLGGQAKVSEVTGVWKELTESVNSMANNLTAQVRNIADVTIAVANGDLSQEDHRRRARRDPAAQGGHQHDGRPAALLRLGSDARGPRGRHRGQAGRPGDRARRRRHLEGPHRLVNAMCGNLTDQVRNIAEVTTAVARGDLSKKITVDVRARSSSSRTPSTRWSIS